MEAIQKDGFGFNESISLGLFYGKIRLRIQLEFLGSNEKAFKVLRYFLWYLIIIDNLR